MSKQVLFYVISGSLAGFGVIFELLAIVLVAYFALR